MMTSDFPLLLPMRRSKFRKPILKEVELYFKLIFLCLQQWNMSDLLGRNDANDK